MSNQSQNPKIGYSVTGIFRGYKMVTKDSFVNHFIGIQSGEVDNGYGEIESVITEIEIYGDHLLTIPSIANDIIGRHVRVWYYPKVLFGIIKEGKRQGQAYGFLKQVMLKNSFIEFLDSASLSAVDTKKTA